MIEILGGFDLPKAFEYLGISGEKTYHGNSCCVWKLSESDFKILNDVPNADWKDEWGWWRYAKGCNITYYPAHRFFVNNQIMLGFYEEDRLEYHIKYWTKDGEMTKEEAIRDFFSTKYKGIRSYLCDEIGASTETNVCAIAVDLARINHMTLGELFSKYGDG